MWTIKAQSEHNLRDRIIVVEYIVDSRERIKNLPDIKHAGLWNRQNLDFTFLNAKPGSYKVKTKFEFLMEYYNTLDDNSKSIINKLNAVKYLLLLNNSHCNSLTGHLKSIGGYGIEHNQEVKHNKWKTVLIICTNVTNSV